MGIFEELGDLCNKYRLYYLILFGSRAKGLHDELSDWDFAARFYRRPGIIEYLELLGDLVDIVKDDSVDLVIVNERIPPPLLFNILWKGRLLCSLDKNVYHWDRVKSSALYSEYLQVFYPEIAARVYS